MSLIRGEQITGSVSSSISSSYALTASYVAKASSFPYTGSATITGSLVVSGTIDVTGLISGTASYASYSTTSSYINPLIQNVIITGSTFISSSNNTQLQVGDNIVFISSSGRVGIGTLTPQTQLDLIGSYRQYQANGVMGLYNISTANANQVKGTWDFYTNAAVTPDFFGRFGFKFEGGIADSNKQFQIHVADSTTPKVIIDGAGRMGIGTITPSSSLDILLNSQGANATGALALTNTSTSSAAIPQQSSPALIFKGSSWDTTNLQSTSSYFRVYSKQANNSSGNLYGQLYFDYSTNGTTWTNAFWTQNSWITATNGFVGADLQINRVRPYQNDYVQIMVNRSSLFEVARFTIGSVNAPSGSLGIGTTLPQAVLHISGASTASTLLQIDAPNTSSILFVSGSGNIGINTNAPTYNLEVAGSSTNTARFYGNSGTALVAIGANGILNSGGSQFRMYGNTNIPLALGSYNTYGDLWIINGNTGIGYGTTLPTLTSKFSIRGSGATSATINFIIQNSTPINLLSINDIGQVTFTSPTMSLAASQSAFSINQQISQSATLGAQVYGVNITPTFFQTTGSQTQTALRVAATFTQSNATATSGSNIIADFGATSVGSQLTVTDITSGSIYMVNDVSGLPIIEATSNWDVNIYDYPNIVLKKTGSNINIYGTLNATGSFILPQSQSTTPQTGSAYWSGSLLFVYNGIRYMSSSFA